MVYMRVWFVLPTASKYWEKSANLKLIRPTAGHPSVRRGLPAQVILRRTALYRYSHNRTTVRFLIGLDILQPLANSTESARRSAELRAVNLTLWKESSSLVGE